MSYFCRNLVASALVFVAACALTISARGAFPLTDSPGADDFLLVAKNGQCAAICVESGEDKAVHRAANDLADDIERVTGVKPKIVDNPEAWKGDIVIIGALGRDSGLVEKLTAAGKVDVSGVRGQWESHITQTVSDSGRHALVIAGSDRRGTIYGIYELSESIGVSPWVWWADVPVKERSIAALRAGTYKQGPPAVKYRGIFLNDEDWGLRPWSSQTFDPANGNIGPKTYAKIFELLLRLKANHLWPAMHEGTRAFNADPENARLAEEYGIVMGSSHAEPMLRNNVDEWKPETMGEFDYVHNRDGVMHYWEDRVKQNAGFESIYTMGMRGIHDSGMLGGGTPREKAERMHGIIAEQRKLFGQYINPDPARVPQTLCPYKEVLSLYRLAPDYPQDITLVWPDDNFGYVRQFSNSAERQRSGGAGVYYHLSYWGAPHDYLWLESTAPALVWEETSKAWDYGARTVWVANVGDIKPAEWMMEYFLKLAWNPHAVGPENTDAPFKEIIERDFGAERAGEIAGILSEYYHLNFQRKPEHMRVEPDKFLFSPMLNGDEAQGRLDAFRALLARANALEEKLPAEQRAAYYQLVLYPVRGAAWMNEKWLGLTKYYAYAKQGRASTAKFLEDARRAQAEIRRETDYYNNQLSGGKWRGMMSDHPRKLAVFDLPEIPPQAIPFPDEAKLAVALEGSEPPLMAGREVFGRLPMFHSQSPRRYFIDVFNGGGKPLLHWTATPNADWIELSREEGDGDTRIWVSVDPDKAPPEEEISGAIQFVSAGQPSLRVEVNLYKARASQSAAFIEENGSIAIEAENFSANAPGKEAAWKTINGLGYNGKAVSIYPTLFAALDTPERIRAESPCLTYNVQLRTAGGLKVVARTLPTWPVEAGRPPRYAVAFDDEPPQMVSLPPYMEEKNPQWQQDVLRNAAMTTSAHRIDRPGAHVLKVWAVDPGIVVDAIRVDCIGAAPAK